MAAFHDLIVGLLYPRNATCIACPTMRVDVPEWGLCAACAKELQPLEDAHMAPPGDALDACVSAYAYDRTARRLVRVLKYQNVVQAADALADGMAQVLPPEQFDGLVPVPLHKRRQRTRGFNQAHALCQALSTRTGLPVVEALARTRDTRTQTELSRHLRAENVRDAFIVQGSVAGKRLVLIDDVFTTGATSQACAHALKEAGAVHICLLTAARAEEKKEV